MKIQYLLIFLIFLSLSAASDVENSCVLKVVGPKRLSELFVKDSFGIPNTLSPYGKTPWGKTLTGKVELASPIDACSGLKQQNPQSPTTRSFLFVEYSKNDNCRIETKIYNAQIYGARLVILAINDDGLQNITPLDEKKLSLISIPVVLITKKNGLTIKNAVQNTIDDQIPTLVATFPSKQVGKNHIVAYVDIDTLETYILLVNLAKYIQQHPNKHELEIHYKINESLFEDFSDSDNQNEASKQRAKKREEKKQKSCYGDGKYCDVSNPTALREIIRQSCLYGIAEQDFFGYLSQMHRLYSNNFADQLQRIHEQDISPFNFDDNFTTALKSTNVSEAQLKQCYDSTFIDPLSTSRRGLADEVPQSYVNDNIILDSELEIWENLKDHNQLPCVVINNSKVWPLLMVSYTNEVISTLCQADGDDSSSVCSPYFKVKKNDSKAGLSTGSIILIIFGSLIGGGIICYVAAKLYNRYQQNSYNKELEQIDSLVQSYIELNNEREDIKDDTSKETKSL